MYQQPRLFYLRIVALLAFCAHPLLGGVVMYRSVGGGPSVPLPGPNFIIPANFGRQKGGNLFESFSQFNLNSSQSATFTGPANVQNILARVTSGGPSSIDGRISSDIQGANLFFMNPAGVLFGQHAQLDVSGSFAVTTANYLNLVGGGRFNANLGGGDVLTSAPVSAFGFLNSTPGGVSITGSTLNVTSQKSFSAVAGDITMNGGRISGAGSRVNLVSVKSAGEAKLDATALATDLNSAIDVTQFTAMGKIDITSKARIISAPIISEKDKTSGLGGPVFIRAGTFLLENDSLINSTSVDGSLNKDGSVNRVNEVSKIDVRAHDVQILGSKVAAPTFGTADAGQVTIAADSLLIDGQGKSTTGLLALAVNLPSGPPVSGTGGHITVTAAKVTITNSGEIGAFSAGTGGGGTINITAHDSLLIDGKGVIGPGLSAGIFADARNGKGGDITVTATAGDVEIKNGGEISTGTFGEGNGGTVTVIADSIDIDGTGSKDDLIPSNNPLINFSVFHGTGILALGYGGGDGGSIDVHARSLSVVGGGQIAAGAFGEGNGGMVTVTADSLLIDGTGAVGNVLFGTGIFTDAEPSVVSDASGNVSIFGTSAKAGRIIVRATTNLTVTSGGEISSSTSTDGNGGTVSVTAGSLSVDGSGTGIFADTKPFLFVDSHGKELSFHGHGDAGNVSVQAANATITAGGQIAASTFGAGDGGSVEVTAKNSLLIHGSDSGLFAVAGFAGLLSSGTGGDVGVKAGDLSLQNSGAISAASFTSADAGSVKLNLGTLSLDSGSSISSANSSTNNSSANTGDGKAGSVTINTTGPVTVKHGSSISTSSTVGDAGTIELTSGGEIKLKDQSRITASAGVNGGDITITAPGQLVYLADSSVTATAGSTGSSGTGGNITIDHPQFIVASNSLISANATVGTAGNVYLNSDFLFSSNSTIFATGTINITAPTLDLGAQLITLPNSLLSAANQLQERCTTLLQGDFSSFISIGRGGTEPAPEELQEEF